MAHDTLDNADPARQARAEVEAHLNRLVLPNACTELEDKLAYIREHPLTANECRTIIDYGNEQRRRADVLEGVIKSHAGHLWNDIERMLEEL